MNYSKALKIGRHLDGILGSLKVPRPTVDRCVCEYYHHLSQVPTSLSIDAVLLGFFIKINSNKNRSKAASFLGSQTTANTAYYHLVKHSAGKSDDIKSTATTSSSISPEIGPLGSNDPTLMETSSSESKASKRKSRWKRKMQRLTGLQFTPLPAISVDKTKQQAPTQAKKLCEHPLSKGFTGDVSYGPSDGKMTTESRNVLNSTALLAYDHLKQSLNPSGLPPHQASSTILNAASDLVRFVKPPIPVTECIVSQPKGGRIEKKPKKTGPVQAKKKIYAKPVKTREDITRDELIWLNSATPKMMKIRCKAWSSAKLRAAYAVPTLAHATQNWIAQRLKNS